jgi:hypothetical protein
MSSRFGFSLSGNEGRSRAKMSRGTGKPFMSPKQIDAYLIARDALRRVQRASSVPPSRRALDFVGGTRASDRRSLDS